MLTALLFSVPSLAYWRMACVSPVTVDRIDPIVNPGEASSHLHTIMGASNIRMTTSYDELRQSHCTSCQISQDLSAYWTPTLYYQGADSTFQYVPQIGGATIYYLQRGNDPMVAFPQGFRMLAGNTMARSDAGTLASKAISHKCIDYNVDHPETAHFPNIDCPNGLRTQIVFPSCWDGVNLDSPDHTSHVAYPDQVNNGNCPASHPKRFITLFYEVLWDITQFKNQWPNGQWPFVLSNGDPTGYGHHGDFINGWEPDFLQTAIDTCTNDSGRVEDCAPFNLIPQNETTQCRNEPYIKEPRFGHLNKLPGCNPVQGGPGPATKQAKCPVATLIPPTPPSATTTYTNLPTSSVTIPAFTEVWTGIDATIVAGGWIGYDYLLKYDSYICSDLCLQRNGCVYFVHYYEQQLDGSKWPICQYYNAVWGADKAINNGWGGKPITQGQAWGLTSWVPGANAQVPSSIITAPVETPTTTTSAIQLVPPVSQSTSTKSAAPPAPSSKALPPASSGPRPTPTTVPTPSSAPGTLPSYGSWSSVGCYSDSSARALTNFVSISGLTVGKCLDACALRGFAYGGVEYGGECYCDSSLWNNAAQVSDGCNQPCKGDNTEICGGDWRINVYKTSQLTTNPPSVLTAYTSWSSLGCFTEGSGGNALEALLVEGLVTADACLDTCASKGYKYGGLEDGSQCYCGNTLRFGSQKADNGCTVVCSNNYRQICGGPGRLSMYSNSAFTGLGFVANDPSAKQQGVNSTLPIAEDLRDEGRSFLATRVPVSTIPIPASTSLVTYTGPSSEDISSTSSMRFVQATLSSNRTTSTTHTPFIRGRTLPTFLSK